GGDSGAWRAEWKGQALTPTELAAWHEHFDHDAASAWLRAGVRDPGAAGRLVARGFEPKQVRRVASDRVSHAFKDIPVTRDDLMSAAGQLARAGGSPDIRVRLQLAAGRTDADGPTEVSVELIDDVLTELQRLDEMGTRGAPPA